MSKTVKEIIEAADELRPNAFSGARKTDWLTRIENRVQLEVLLDAEADLASYAWPDDQNTPVLTEPPYDGVYELYLAAMIDLAHGETEAYRASAAAFNELWGAFSRYYARRFAPADEQENAAQFRRWNGGDY